MAGTDTAVTRYHHLLSSVGVSRRFVWKESERLRYYLNDGVSVGFVLGRNRSVIDVTQCM